MYRDDLLRAQQGVKRKTLEDLVTETGLNKNTISDILNGKDKNFGHKSIEKVAAALGVPLSELYQELKTEAAI